MRKVDTDYPAKRYSEAVRAQARADLLEKMVLVIPKLTSAIVLYTIYLVKESEYKEEVAKYADPFKKSRYYHGVIKPWGESLGFKLKYLDYEQGY